MAGDDQTRDLIRGALSEPAEPTEQSSDTAEEQPTTVEPVAATELIAVYFELEDPLERDALLDKLRADRTEEVTAFFRSMVADDEDEVAQSIARAELARRGDGDAVAELQQDLEDPEDLEAFGFALQTLAEIRGVGFYDIASGLWSNPERTVEERQEALGVMELLDLERALPQLCEWVEGSEVASLHEDLLEAVMLVFARHDYSPALAPLEGLQGRLASAGLDDDAVEEIDALVADGIALLRRES